MTTDSETLAAILAELQALRHDLSATKPARVFVPEDVRGALGADRVELVQNGNLWRLVVWFGKIPSFLESIHGTHESVAYTALSDVGFTTEEAVAIIQKQRPTVPACEAG